MVVCLSIYIISDRNHRSHALYLIQTRISNSKALLSWVDLSSVKERKKKPDEEMRKRYKRNEINNKKRYKKKQRSIPSHPSKQYKFILTKKKLLRQKQKYPSDEWKKLKEMYENSGRGGTGMSHSDERIEYIKCVKNVFIFSLGSWAWFKKLVDCLKKHWPRWWNDCRMIN